MKKILLFLLAFSGVSFADDHGSDIYYAYFGMTVSNPPAVVAAMDKFMASECGQTAPFSVALMGEAFNGHEPQTHTFVVTYEGAQALNDTFATLSTCPEYGTFLTELSAVSVATEQTLVKSVYESGDWTQDTAFAVFEINVRNEASYIDAYKKFTDAAIANGQLTRSFGVERVVAGDDYTHFAFIGGSDMANLMATMDLLNMDNADFAEFQNSVRRNRSIVRRGIVTPIKAWD